jgi:hypothetical protein
MAGMLGVDAVADRAADSVAAEQKGAASAAPKTEEAK